VSHHRSSNEPLRGTSCIAHERRFIVVIMGVETEQRRWRVGSKTGDDVSIPAGSKAWCICADTQKPWDSSQRSADGPTLQRTQSLPPDCGAFGGAHWLVWGVGRTAPGGMDKIGAACPASHRHHEMPTRARMIGGEAVALRGQSGRK